MTAPDSHGPAAPVDFATALADLVDPQALRDLAASPKVCGKNNALRAAAAAIESHREALRKIASCPCRSQGACLKVGMERLRCVTCIARAELGELTVVQHSWGTSSSVRPGAGA